ncbi:type II secretion system protein J [Patescibacteria group bacterium]
MIIAKKNKGFTLIEMIVYIAILSVIVVALSSFLMWVLKANAKSNSIKEVLDSSRRFMEIITYEIKGAKSIYLPTTTSTQLSLETIRYFPDGENSTYIDFYLATSTIFLKKESQGPVAITSDKVEVNSLSFSQIQSTSTFPSIQISLEISYKNPDNRLEYTSSINLTSTITLRVY